MKKLIISGILIVTLVLMCLAVAAAAVDETWLVQFRPYNGTATAGTLSLGTRPGAGDVWIMGEDAVFPTPAANGAAEIVSTLLPGQRTSTDIRTPLNETTRTQVIWNLSMYIVGGQPGTIRLDGWVGGGANVLDPTSPYLRVRLYQGSTLLWTLPLGTTGTQAEPLWSHYFVYTGTPIEMQLVADVVPEPGSAVAMLSGILGCIGFGIRRRR